MKTDYPRNISLNRVWSFGMKFSIDTPDQTHLNFKVACMQNGKSMREELNQFMIDYAKKVKTKKEKRHGTSI